VSQPLFGRLFGLGKMVLIVALITGLSLLFFVVLVLPPSFGVLPARVGKDEATGIKSGGQLFETDL